LIVNQELGVQFPPGGALETCFVLEIGDFMAGPAYNPEKDPGQEENLKKIPKKKGPPKDSKKKCLACNEGFVLIHGKVKACSTCKGNGYIR
jgi:hypothetical protein